MVLKGGGLRFSIVLPCKVLFSFFSKATRSFLIFIWGLSFSHWINLLWVGITIRVWQISGVFSCWLLYLPSLLPLSEVLLHCIVPGTQKDGRSFVCVCVCVCFPIINWSSWNEINLEPCLIWIHKSCPSLAQIRSCIFVPKERNHDHCYHHFGYYFLCGYRAPNNVLSDIVCLISCNPYNRTVPILALRQLRLFVQSQDLNFVLFTPKLMLCLPFNALRVEF